MFRLTDKLSRLFDDTGEGFISIHRFKVCIYLQKFFKKILVFIFQAILKEIDNDFSDDELDEIIAEVRRS